MAAESLPDESIPNKRKGCGIAVVTTIVLLAIAWIVIRPGVFTIQPIGAIPEGVTMVYHSRNPKMPFFASPDGMCLKIQGSVTLLCRIAVLSATKELTNRVILRLPYIHWTYLLSTGGSEFER